jgi:hypothetical protein
MSGLGSQLQLPAARQTALRREVVFVHIPKTGGTSVRRSLEIGLKGRQMLRDYQDHPLATPALNHLVHVEGRIQDFRKVYPGDRRMLLSGHFPASRYWEYFNAESFVTFLRHPVDRMVSAYASWKKQGRWAGSFEEFARQRGADRRMASFLTGVDLHSFGFIGFLEDYDRSLQALCEFVGAELPGRNINIGDYTTLARDEMTANKAVAAAVLKNSPDLRLYEQMYKSRARSFRSLGADHAVATKYAGHVSREADAVSGWLTNTAREFIAGVEIFSGGERLTSVRADRYREDIKQLGVSRSGVCGFRIGLKRLGVGEGQTLIFRAAGSAFELEGSPIYL